MPTPFLALLESWKICGVPKVNSHPAVKLKAMQLVDELNDARSSVELNDRAIRHFYAKDEQKASHSVPQWLKAMLHMKQVSGIIGHDSKPFVPILVERRPDVGDTQQLS